MERDEPPLLPPRPSLGPVSSRTLTLPDPPQPTLLSRLPRDLLSELSQYQGPELIAMCDRGPIEIQRLCNSYEFWARLPVTQGEPALDPSELQRFANEKGYRPIDAYFMYRYGKTIDRLMRYFQRGEFSFQDLHALPTVVIAYVLSRASLGPRQYKNIVYEILAMSNRYDLLMWLLPHASDSKRTSEAVVRNIERHIGTNPELLDILVKMDKSKLPKTWNELSLILTVQGSGNVELARYLLSVRPVSMKTLSIMVYRAGKAANLAMLDLLVDYVEDNYDGKTASKIFAKALNELDPANPNELLAIRHIHGYRGT